MLKRSVINKTIQDASKAFAEHHWHLPPEPRWDITDFGLGDFDSYGLTLINLAEEPEYCEKLMFAYENQRTPAHTHAKKKEDIICRCGTLVLQLWPDKPDTAGMEPFEVPVNGQPVTVKPGEIIEIGQGSRITLVPGVYHEFWSGTPYCIIGEVSTANDDLNDNFFVNEQIGRFPGIEEDEPPLLKLLSES
jgi:D-lyxose ketol-isomerase